jgi:hypothetical protein
MDCATRSARLTKRRRILWSGALAALLLAVLWLLFAGAYLVPRLRDHDGEWRNPVQVVKDWIFPPRVDVIFADFDGDGVLLLMGEANGPVKAHDFDDGLIDE